MIRPLAIYLPQFHPIPENDKWWGKGFTEWTNVTKTRPLFKEHYQPHLPSDLGFYDLRLHDVLVEQAELAKSSGIYGFMFYHYWFSGKKLLERPLEQLLKNSKPDIPFCVCWANENWTRRWDGKDEEVLIKQEYSLRDDLNHFAELLNYFKDSRYIKVDGKPIFVVYRTNLFPNIKETALLWRQEALNYGFPGIYLVTTESFGNRINPEEIGFDAAIDFQPDFEMLPQRYLGSFVDRLLNKLKIKKSPFLENNVYDYKDYAEIMMNKNEVNYKLFPGITPMWDNSARRSNNAIILKDSSPEQYGKWLERIMQKFKPFSVDENFVIINAWNEWAEGNHLEPCRKWGRQYLEVTKSILQDNNVIAKL